MSTWNYYKNIEKKKKKNMTLMTPVTPIWYLIIVSILVNTRSYNQYSIYHLKIIFNMDNLNIN